MTVLIGVLLLSLAAAQADEDALDRVERLLIDAPAEAVIQATAFEPSDVAGQVRRAVVLARAQLSLGAAREAEAALEEVRAVRDRADPVLQSRWHRTRATVAFSLGKFDHAVSASRHSLRLLDETDSPSDRAEALAVALQVALGARTYPEALGHASQLQGLLDRSEVDLGVRRDGWMMLAALHREFEDDDRSIEAYDRAATVAEALGDLTGQADARFAKAQVQIEAQRELERAGAELDGLEVFYRERGDEFGIAMVRVERARLALVLEDFETARDAAGRAREGLATLSVPVLAQLAFQFEAEALLALDRPSEAAEILAQLDADYPDLPRVANRIRLDARVAEALGQWPEAYRASREQIRKERDDATRRLSIATERARARLDHEAARLRSREMQVELRLREVEVETARKTALLQKLSLALALALAGSLGWMLVRQRRGARMLARLAMQDVLTCLPNRRAFFEQARRLVHQAERSGLPLCMLMIDLDRFKRINDEFGHAEGDRVLADFGATLQATARTSDLPARLGGEEFGLLLPNSDAAGGHQLAERLLDRLRAGPESVRGTAGRVTASIGLACYVPGDSVERLIQRADAAMYSAKQQGRDRVVHAEGS